AIGIQGYEKRAVSTPLAENDLMGSQEAFTEAIRINMSLIRRRLKDNDLKFEMSTAGEISGTDVCLVYLQHKADPKMVERIKEKLESTGLESIMGAGFVKPFLEESGEVSLFSETGYTERPDVLAVDLIKGHIGILIDGSPFCLIYPYMFSQNFETMDDYSSKSYYAVFIKLIRYAAFILAVIFPGLYLAAVNFHPELLNMKLLLNLSMSEKTTFVTLFTEMIVIMILLEIMREASVRLPRAIGTAMSIAGGLIIGDTAVKSGIISSPLLIIVGITATASFVLPQLTQQITILRLMFIFAGGFAGFMGISICAVMTLTNICAQSLSGVALTSPLSPFRRSEIMNVLGKKNYIQLAKDRPSIRSFK
ncbi:MAG: spore germination protein, partial [Ruminococcus sp.]|nr:spore germination protein [Ruminococcus sp.]